MMEITICTSLIGQSIMLLQSVVSVCLKGLSEACACAGVQLLGIRGPQGIPSLQRLTMRNCVKTSSCHCIVQCVASTAMAMPFRHVVGRQRLPSWHDEAVASGIKPLCITCL